jgi:hypothetical protein
MFCRGLSLSLKLEGVGWIRAKLSQYRLDISCVLTIKVLLLTNCIQIHIDFLTLGHRINQAGMRHSGRTVHNVQMAACSSCSPLSVDSEKRHQHSYLSIHFGCIGMILPDIYTSCASCQKTAAYQLIILLQWN